MLLVALLVSLAAVTVRLGQLQSLGATSYAAMGVAQRVQQVNVEGQRGSILDRNGHDLAISVPQVSVFANPWLINDPQAVAATLAPIITDKTQDQLTQLLTRRKVTDKNKRVPLEFVYLARRIDDATWQRIKALHLPGISSVPESKRFYPAGDIAASVLGFVRENDSKGLEGLESKQDGILQGQEGLYYVERDPQGNRLPGSARQQRPSRRGTDLVLTLDESVQFEAERALLDAVTQYNARGGTVIVADPRNGDVLAMANVVGNPGAQAHLADRTHNAALLDVYEPGSTNKVVTIAAALEAGLVTPDTHFLVPDKMRVAAHTFSDHEPHSPTDWTTTDILTNSSNVGTIMIGQKVGNAGLDAAMRKFGYGQPTGVGTFEERGIVLPLNRWSATTIATVPIGMGLAVTAMQMLDVYMTIANGGEARPPRIVAATIDSKGKRHDRPVGATHPVIQAITANQLNLMLQNVVKTGTGTLAAIPGYTVAGKTGTARKSEEGKGYSGGHYVASFVGFVPAEAPRLAAIVVLDDPHPIYGGQVAAPTFARVVQYALRAMRVPPPPPSAAPATAPANATPGKNSKPPVELDGPADTADDGSDKTPPPSAPPAKSTKPPNH